jgi:LmbE family N-acetylglucosaminyl deacetylase
MLNMPRKRVLFIAPHADDIEIFCCYACQAAVNAGYEVHESLSCRDEYGTNRSGWHGRRLAKIRVHEMNEAAKAYGINVENQAKIKLHWLPYIDGHVPFNRKSVHQFQDLIQTIQPALIFGPDPFFPLDSHPDHLATGRNYYFALKNIPSNERPALMCFYQSFKSDFFLPVSSPSIAYNVRSKHRSQFHPLELLGLKLYGFVLGRSLNLGGKRVEKLRKITFLKNDNQIQESQNLWGLRLKRAFWCYSFGLGQAGSINFQDPPVTAIIEDYSKHGWP